MRQSSPPPGAFVPREFLVALALLLVVGVCARWVGGFLHDALSLTPFYLGPIAFCSWFCARRWAFSLTVIAAVILYFASQGLGPSLLTEVTMVALQFVTYNMVAALVTHLRKSTRRESALARLDVLTGLSNSRAFTEAAEAEIDRMRRYGKPLSAAYFDLDHFKKVNDEGGHEGGDDALRLIGDALSHCVRSIDTAARMGGDEFVLLMPETSREGAQAVAERLHEKVNELSKGKLTCSMGCVTFTVPPQSVDDLLRVADEAMYAAKKNGRDRVVFVHQDRPSITEASMQSR